MRKAVLLLLLAGLVGCNDGIVAPQTSVETAIAEERAAHPAGFIVVLKRGVDRAQVAAQHGVRPEFLYSHALNGFAGSISEAARMGLLQDQRVERIVRDGVVTAHSSQSNPPWGLDRIDQRALPLSKSYAYQETGAGVSVYIFDTGIRYDHTEFEGRAVPGFDVFSDGRNGSDCHGHGTHVAGTVGGRTYGVAKGVRLVSVRVLDCKGSGTWSGVIAAMDWVIRTNTGPAVANFSIGGNYNEVVNSALRNLIAAGVQASVAAGNDSGDACTQSPGSTLEAITVGATTSSDQRASYSNFGSCVDLFAPGSSIVSAAHASTTGSTTMSGTSMAAPHVAGIAALFLQANPTLTPQQLRDAIWTAATKGIVGDARSENAHLAYSLEEASTPPLPPPPPAASPPAAPANLTLKLVALNRVDLSWTDRSDNEESFEIQRRLGSGTWATLVSVGANSTSYSDLSVQSGQTYSYRARAVNDAGASAFSNEATITVQCQTKGKSSNCK